MHQRLSVCIRPGLWLAISLLCAGCAQFASNGDESAAVTESASPQGSSQFPDSMREVQSSAISTAPSVLASAVRDAVAVVPSAPTEASAVIAGIVAPAGTLAAMGEATAAEPSAVPQLPLTPSPHQQSPDQQSPHQQSRVRQLCEQIGNKLGSVSVQDCSKQAFVDSDGHSVNGRPLVIKEYLPQGERGRSDFKVLLMGGIHGDEYSSISIIFKWLDLFAAEGLEGEFHWLFAPVVNPDGLLDGNRAKRQNANGVDLNRNFPSQDWSASAVAYWQESTGSNPRRYPGKEAASEPEVQWLVTQIERFQPDVIVSVHAPYHLLDFDGPAAAPDRIGELYLHQLGVYPGSLGNYAGLNKRIPVVTLELPSAGIMPPADQITLMWHDLVRWLDQEGRKALGEPSSGAPVLSSTAPGE